MNPPFEKKMSAIPGENGLRIGCAVIVNHYAIVNLLRRADLLRRSKLSARRGPLGSENCTGNIASFKAKRRLLVNPYGPEIQTEFCYLSRGK